ncbi:MAG: antitoxin [Actinobacteria bacterium]|nr:antitoxin [Actinomycetota bacterium]
MGLMDEVNKLAQKAKDAAAEHPDQVRKAIDQAEDQIDKRTGGKHASQIDSAGDKVADFLAPEADRPAAPPEPGADRP